MTTYNRICIKTHTIRGKDEDGKDAEMTIERGREYLTGEEKDGKVVVFSQYWVSMPVDLFAGEVKFT